MKCPHCTVNFHDNWVESYFERGNYHVIETLDEKKLYWFYRTTYCPECKRVVIEVSQRDSKASAAQWRQIYPTGASRGPVSPEVPKDIAADYLEACNVLPISAKASAALSRRCLQSILHQAGYRARDLAKELDLLLSEPDPRKAIPHQLRETVDAIRHFGNFSAHPIDDKTTLQIIDVEPHEAEWCLEVIEDLFLHFYVAPAAAKAKKDALNAKLAAGGKPPAK
ncbi:DUF4145 domain-containing protein [Bradyrhizobium aeschynomenes]|uniref:DUF4145 domain-containing protein n=1 Tax=Bradyrhizobium aeschynomenes TaxID=2734909 RepID=UPI001552ADC2|nr:DUF4145 domain-containing protein [Bradyrhizobium aeschynomenes]NPV21479.1 DUF4145 domain-containing protein [Bradyrhizobium aeschynomenes]